MSETKTSEICIDVESHRDFEKEIAKLNRQARRLGVPEVTYSYEGEAKRIRTKVTTGDGESTEESYPVTVKRYLVSRPVIRDNGWKIIGNISRADDGRNLVAITQPGVEVDRAKYEKGDAGRCEHCNTIRNRNQTYLVQHNGERILQVGRACLGELTQGADLRHLEFQVVLEWNFGSDEWPGGGGGSRSVRTESVRDIILLSLIHLRSDGWRDNQYDDSGEVTSPGTHRLVAHRIRQGSQWRVECYELITEELVLEAENLIEEVQAINADDLDDFGKEIHYHLSFARVPVAKAGLVAYAYRWLQRHKEAIARKALEANDLNDYIGEEGQRGTFHNLTLRRTSGWESDYGWTTLCIWADDQGRKVVYIGSGAVDPGEVGTACRLKATIKHHNERDGVKQTVISRIADLHIYADGDVRASGFETKKSKAKK
jgi:hypothetical protein